MRVENNAGTIKSTVFKSALTLLLILFLASCGSGQSDVTAAKQEPALSNETANPPVPAAQGIAPSVAAEPSREAPQETESTIAPASEPDGGGTDGNPPVFVEADGAQAEAAQVNTIYLQIGEQTYSATLAANSSAQALKELLAAGPVTIDMRDYGNMEIADHLNAWLAEKGLDRKEE